jgi:putative phosphoesterase
MKILVLSDIHANWYALETVLAKENYDALIFLGDVVDFGANPRECIRFLMSSSKGLFWGVRGDHDHAMAYGTSCNCSEELSRLSTITREWGESLLANREIGFLRRLPLNNRFTIDGLNFYLTHSLENVRIHSDIISDDTSKLAQLSALPETQHEGLRQAHSKNIGLENKFDGINFILVGHSHKPFIKQLDKITVLNPGSVGQPRDFNPRVSYAVIEDGKATIKRISYDIEKTVRDLEKSTLPKDVISRLTSILVVGGVIDEREDFKFNQQL